jgi:hypothetical protein
MSHQSTRKCKEQAARKNTLSRREDPAPFLASYPGLPTKRRKTAPDALCAHSPISNHTTPPAPPRLLTSTYSPTPRLHHRLSRFQPSRRSILPSHGSRKRHCPFTTWAPPNPASNEPVSCPLGATHKNNTISLQISRPTRHHNPWTGRPATLPPPTSPIFSSLPDPLSPNGLLVGGILCIT